MAGPGLRSTPQAPGGPPPGAGGGDWGGNLDVIKSASQHVENVGATMEREIASMFERLELSRNQWDGESRDAFDKARGDMVKPLKDLTNALIEIANGLGTTQKDIAQFQMETAASIRSVTQGVL